MLTWLNRVLPTTNVTPIEVHDPPLTAILAGLALIVYAVTRFIGLSRFPIKNCTSRLRDWVEAGISRFTSGRLFFNNQARSANRANPRE